MEGLSCPRNCYGRTGSNLPQLRGVANDASYNGYGAGRAYFVANSTAPAIMATLRSMLQTPTARSTCQSFLVQSLRQEGQRLSERRYSASLLFRLPTVKQFPQAGGIGLGLLGPRLGLPSVRSGCVALGLRRLARLPFPG
jgi:hypothetical protein